MTESMSFPMYYAFDGATPPARSGAAHATIYPYGPFPVGDGSTVMLGLQNEREWVVFCEKVLKQPELAAHPDFNATSKRVANRDRLRTIIVGAFATMTADQVIKLLEDSQIANARVNEMKDVWAHPQLKARNRWKQVGSPVGDLPALIPPATNSAFSARMDPIPALGDHTMSILNELGVQQSVIEEMKSAKAI